MKVLLESQTFVDGSAANRFFGLSSSSILETMMSGVDTPVRSPSAFTRFAQGGQDDPILSAAAGGAMPWPGQQQPQQQPPGMPASFGNFNIGVESTPGVASNLGEPPAQEDIQAQMASMLAAIKHMYDQLQKLAAKAQQQQQPQQQQPQPQQPQPQQQQPQQPQLQQQAQRVDPWQQSLNSGGGGVPAGSGGYGNGGFQGGSGGFQGGSGAWAEIHYKDVSPPQKFKGGGQWRYWFTKFATFLTRRNAKWDTLLNSIREDSKNPYEIDGVKEAEIFIKIGVNPSDVDLKIKIKSQLYEYLENFTEGLTHSMVVSAGPRGSLEAFRQMCDEGFSSRDRNLRKEYRRVTQPKQVTFENLKKAILDWEMELSQYELAAGPQSAMGEKERIMCLEDMCPDPLQQYLESKENLVTYSNYKLAIHDYLVNRARWAGRSRINWIGAQEDFGASYSEEAEKLEDPEEPSGEAIAAFLEHFPQLNAISGEINALVKNKFGKSNKGNGKKGKATGKGGGDNGGGGGKDDGGKDKDEKKGKGKGRKCFECDGDDHIARDCSIRKERVAKGGPERLPKGKGRDMGYPTQAQWNKWNPGPSASTWRGWYPSAQGKGGFQGGAFQGTPMQLSPFSAIGSGQAVLQSLFGSPFQISCINAKPVTQSKCKSVRYAETSGEQVAVPADEGSLPETFQRGPHQWTDARNSFSALASQEAGKDDEDGMGAPETTPAPPTWLYPRKKKQNLKLTTKNGCTARCGSKCSADVLEFVNFKVSKFDSIETIVSTELSDLAKSKLEFDEFGEPLGRPCRSSCGCMGACDENSSLKWDASGKVTRRSSETATSRCNPLMMFNQVQKAQNLMPVSQKEELKTRLGKF